MSVRHPIIAVTGSSGSGTTEVKQTFEQIFWRENVHGVIVDGDSFYRHSREEITRRIEAAERQGKQAPSHFGPEGSDFSGIERLFREYGETGRSRIRHYLHDEVEAVRFGGAIGTFTEWQDTPDDSDILLYEGMHGAVKTDKVDVARYPDLIIGVVPTINLEWIQKIHRDTRKRGQSLESVTSTILRRMPDYVNYITPQFSRTHINFQRVPVVDTSNPFIARDVPSLEESFVAIRFADPRGIDFPYLLTMMDRSFMSRPNTLVIPGGKLPLAMQLILTPMIWKMMERKLDAE